MSLIRLGKKLKPHSEEAKQKMRLAHLGMKASKETKRKLSLIRLGKKLKPFSEEHK